MKQEIKPINKRIARFRKLAGYTQQTAADALNVKKNTYARMELHGNPTPDMLVKLAALYRVSPNLILFGVDGGETAALREHKEPTRLAEDFHMFKREPDLVLTVNERNCVKACRELSKEERDKVMAFINEMYNESKKSNS